MQEDTHLFLVRLWSKEAEGDRDQAGWRGKVQHVLSGEAHAFQGWPALIDLLLEMAETESFEVGAPAEGADGARGGKS